MTCLQQARDGCKQATAASCVCLYTHLPTLPTHLSSRCQFAVYGLLLFLNQQCKDSKEEPNLSYGPDIELELQFQFSVTVQILQFKSDCSLAISALLVLLTQSKAERVKCHQSLAAWRKGVGRAGDLNSYGSQLTLVLSNIYFTTNV